MRILSLVMFLRLLVMSDIHDRIEKALRILKREDFDAIIICGDFTYFRPLPKVIDYINSIRNSTSAPAYFVPGNCDPEELLELGFEDKKFYNIHRKVIKIRNIQVAGIGGGGISPFNTNIEFNEDEFTEIVDDIKREIRANLPLIVVTHLPPHNTVDFVSPGKPIGSRAIRIFAEEAKPMAIFSGHVHESRGITRIGKTIVANPGPVMRGYYAVANLENNRISIELKALASK